MPVVSITLLPGYSATAKERLVGRVARSVRSVIAASNAGTTVMVHEASTYQRDGRCMTQGGPELPDASALVQRFLERMQSRDLESAQTLLDPGFVMHFPGAAPMHHLEELVQWARPRYRQVSKRYERFDESWSDEGSVVYCFGTLEGVWLDGQPFAGVRFIDRFELKEGRIVRQDVWNDLALAMAAHGTQAH